MILVTGGCGFIGANLVPKLVEQGYRVRVFDNLSRGRLDYLPPQLDFEFHQGDLRDRKALKQALQGISAIIHLAAYGSVIESIANPEENFDINVRGTFNLFDEARLQGIQQIIFSSTGGALIGDADPPVDENSLPRPISPYGSSKLCCEAYCSSFAHAYDMNITALRFANVIGPISWHKKGAVTAFIKNILNQKDITIYGDGSATRDFLYVDDLCDGIIAALNKNLAGFNPLHLASGREVSIKELAELIIELAPVPVKSRIQFLPKRKGEVEKNFAHYDLAKKMIGFEPKTSLEDAIQKTWNWYLKDY